MVQATQMAAGLAAGAAGRMTVLLVDEEPQQEDGAKIRLNVLRECVPGTTTLLVYKQRDHTNRGIHDAWPKSVDRQQPSSDVTSSASSS